MDCHGGTLLFLLVTVILGLVAPVTELEVLTSSNSNEGETAAL